MRAAAAAGVAAGVVMAGSLLVAALVLVPRERPLVPRALESDAEFQQRNIHAQQPRQQTNFMEFADRPVEPFQSPQVHASRVRALPWYTSASQQDEKWGGVHQSGAFPNVAQNAYLYAQHVAQSHTGQLLRWRNYVTQRRSDATPKEQLAQARGMASVASAEYNQARAQLAAMKKMAVIRRLNTKRLEAKELTSDVNRFASGMLRNEDLAQVKQDEAYGKIAEATKILTRMAHSGLLRRKSAARRLRHLQQLPYVVNNVAANAEASMPNVRGYVSNGYQNLPAYGGPPVSDCGPAGSSMAPDTVCNGVPTAAAAIMLGDRLQVTSRILVFVSAFAGASMLRGGGCRLPRRAAAPWSLAALSAQIAARAATPAAAAGPAGAPSCASRPRTPLRESQRASERERALLGIFHKGGLGRRPRT